jgi:hypothetical protein
MAVSDPQALATSGDRTSAADKQSRMLLKLAALASSALMKEL